jgi:pimeloyl-ACP methyl ester carboxylesterase
MLSVGQNVARAQSNIPRMETADCEFELPYDINVTCANLIVPEDRSNPDSPTIRLRFVVFPAYGNDVQADPVVYLEGGPGGDALPSMPWLYYGLGIIFNEQRDVIFFDQRGTGYSRPSLDCPEYDNTLYDMMDKAQTAETARERVLTALAQCRTRLESRGVNVSAYNSAENAADLADLRRVLGYDEWNLYGISYGTRLALTVMRDHPEGIRSVILDSVVPLEVSLYDEQPMNLDHALNVLFLGCAQDDACNTRYPQLGTVFYEMVARLNTEPGTARINHPTTQVEYTILIDGDQLISLAFGALYTPEYFRLLPQIIYDVRDGNYALLASTLQSVLRDQEGFSMGMHFAVQCREETPFATLDGVSEAMRALPALESFFSTEANIGTMMMNVCDEWALGTPSPQENMPVASDIPALVVSGQYDPITPPRWASMVADSLPNSFYYEYPGMGHGVTVSHDCPFEMMLAFVNDPTRAPAADCIAEMPAPEFLVLENTLTMTPFADEGAGVRSVRPEEWLDYGSEFYRSELNDTGILFGSLDVAELTAVPAEDIVDYFLRELAAEYDVYDVPPPIERRAANGFGWEIYEFRRGDNYLDIAITSSDTRIYWVLLLSNFAERDSLYMNALTPAIDALRPY